MIRLSCTFPQKPSSYELIIGGDLLTNPELFASLPYKRAAVVTDTTTEPLYGTSLVDSLAVAGYEIELIPIEPGEEHKTARTKAWIENHLFKRAFGRDTLLFALGGGVVTDLGGFVASTYCRGIPLISCPTTLLGMVDASVGGKTGINTEWGKNLIGTVYQPRMVLMDTGTLSSLPQKEWNNGVVEMLKMGLISSREEFESVKNWKRRDRNSWDQMIASSCTIKRDIVENDERESGLRRVLNYGHTVGHAMEKVANYSISHGEAVAFGSIVEAALSVQMAGLKQDEFEEIKEAFQSLTPSRLPPFDTNRLLEALRHDKKNLEGTPRISLLNQIGKPDPCDGTYCCPVDAKAIVEAIKEAYE